jgi:hypothetical protein
MNDLRQRFEKDTGYTLKDKATYINGEYHGVELYYFVKFALWVEVQDFEVRPPKPTVDYDAVFKAMDVIHAQAMRSIMCEGDDFNMATLRALDHTLAQTMYHLSRGKRSLGESS